MAMPSGDVMEGDGEDQHGAALEAGPAGGVFPAEQGPLLCQAGEDTVPAKQQDSAPP